MKWHLNNLIILLMNLMIQKEKNLELGDKMNLETLKNEYEKM